MKKVKLVIAAVSMLLLFSGSVASADGFAPAEGLYIGLFGGHGAGHVSAKLDATTATVDSSDDTTTTTTTAELTDGGIGLSGALGGAWVGYGYKMGPLYAGFEWDFSAGGEKFEATCAGAGCDIGKQWGGDGGSTVEVLNSVKAEVQWNTSGGGRIGYYLNPNTLLAIRGGIAASKFDVSTSLDSASYYGGGPAFAASIQSTLSDIDPNLSLRMEYLFVDYMDAPLSGWGDTSSSKPAVNYSVSGQVYQGRLGLAYSFFDVNSLF